MIEIQRRVVQLWGNPAEKRTKILYMCGAFNLKTFMENYNLLCEGQTQPICKEVTFLNIGQLKRSYHIVLDLVIL